MYEFLTSDEFQRYQRRQIEEVVKYVQQLFLLKTPEDFLELKGALDMARQLIRLPQKIVKGGDKKKAMIEAMVTKNIIDFNIRFTKQNLMDE